VIAALEAEALRAGGDATQALGPELLAINGELRKLTRSAKASKAKLHELDRRFHDTVSAACPNAMLLDMLQRLRLQAQRFDGGTARGLANPEWTVREHEAIARAIQAGKLERAAELTREHRRVGIEIVIGWLREQRGAAR